MKILLLTLLIPLTSFSTTRAKEPGQPSVGLCELRAVFLSPHAERVHFTHKKSQRKDDSVFWHVDIKEVSSKEICPELGKVDVRIRGADYREEAGEPVITYPVHISEPKPGDLLRLKVRFVQGRNTFTKKDFAEWLFVEMEND
jgi:hypothetical protein